MKPNSSKKFQTFWSHSSVFPLKKQHKNLNFQSFFTSNRYFGDYFQWNACTYFQKIYNWTRYSDAKLIKNILNFLVALLRFFFTKATYKSKFSPFFLPLINPLVVTFNKRCAPTSRKYVAEQGILRPNWSKKFQTLWLESSVFLLEKQPKNLNFQLFFL